MAGEKVLVVDDEKKLVALLRAYLEREGYAVVGAYDGQEALELFRQQAPDLIVLDLMLPRVDGMEVCRQVRRTSDVPIIMLTARSEDADKLVGLELGADDYVTKPFSPREVVARVRAVLRRAPRQAAAAPPGRVALGDLVVDPERFEATCRGKLLPLTPTEFRILVALARSPGRVYSRGQLLELAAGETYEGYERTVDAHIKNLRRKLNEAGAGRGCTVVTVHGVGYKLQEPDRV